MMLRQVLLVLCIWATTNVLAQDIILTGKVTDKESGEALALATVQLLRTDSSLVTGSMADNQGQFTLKAPQMGNYVVKITTLGYDPLIKPIKISSRERLNLGILAMKTDAIALQEATVTANAAKVVLKEDTLIYNANAYRTPEGSVVEELVRKLPGAQIDDNGKITINGKEVTKILIDGKEFMTGDTKTALKNIPTSVIEHIKAYDEKSDLSRITGIDDGNEQTVLDFGLKKGMNKGTFANIDLAGGTYKRYAERMMGAYFKDKYRIMGFANLNNTNDKGFAGGRQRFGGQPDGLNTTKMIGVNINYEDKNKLKVDASVRWNHNNGDLQTYNTTQNFVNNKGAFSQSNNSNQTRDNSWNGQMRVEWQPDTMTNILFRPTVSYKSNDGKSIETAATFNEDPYIYADNPLQTEALAQLAAQGIAVNSGYNAGISYGNNVNANGTLQINRKLNRKGRNVTLRLNGSYGDTDNKSLSINNVHLYRLYNQAGTDSTYQTNRYTPTPGKKASYSVQATYSEPIFKGGFLQLSYEFTHSFNRSDRTTYNFSNLGETFFADIQPAYRGWNNYLNLLPNKLNTYKDETLSRFSQYNNNTHEVQLMLRVVKSLYHLNVGMMVQPQQSNYVQNYMGRSVDTIRNVVNVSPTLDFRYRFNKQSNLRINYRGTTSQPGMTDLLDIIDDSNPLYVQQGNPGLKPAFTNRFRLLYNNYLSNRQQAIMTFANFSTTRNAISTKITYNAQTGGRLARPENINGNWDAQAGVMYNTAIDSAGVWYINTFTNINYNNYVAYLNKDVQQSDLRNVTRSLNMGERLAAGYRKGWLEIEVDGSLNYTHSHNQWLTQGNIDSWQYGYGATLNLNLPWGMSLSTDLHQNNRRGYADPAMNTSEWIWNAQIAQSLLKNKALTLSLQLYDILHEQSSFSRTINALQRSDTQYNNINSYAMLHVIYRFNAFGGKERRPDNDDFPDDNPRFERRPPRM